MYIQVATRRPICTQILYIEKKVRLSLSSLPLWSQIIYDSNKYKHNKLPSAL